MDRTVSPYDKSGDRSCLEEFYGFVGWFGLRLVLRSPVCVGKWCDDFRIQREFDEGLEFRITPRMERYPRGFGSLEISNDTFACIEMAGRGAVVVP